MPPRDKHSNQQSPLQLIDVVRRLAAHGAIEQSRQEVPPGQVLAWEGIWPQAVAPFAAALSLGNRHPTVIVCSHVVDAETVRDELSALLNREILYFPPISEESEIQSLLQQETTQRLQVLSSLARLERTEQSERAKSESPIVVTTLIALIGSVPSPSQLVADRRIIRQGDRIELESFRSWLVAAGYHATTSVQLPGEFAVRGGIVDLYAPDHPLPVRIEFFDDEVESLRTFEVVSQRKIDPLESFEVLATHGSAKDSSLLFDYLPPSTSIIVHEPKQVEHATNVFLQRVPFPERFQTPQESFAVLSQYPLQFLYQVVDSEHAGPILRVPLNDVQRVGGNLESIAKDVDLAIGSKRAIICAVNEGELQRLHELMKSSTAFQNDQIELTVNSLSHGFEILPQGPIVLCAGQMFRRASLRRPTRRVQSKAIDSFLDLREGDLIVHLSHGIGVYRGMSLLDKHGQRQEHLELEFAEGSKLYVPASKIDLVQRYVGGTKSKPKLAKIGGQTWLRQKKAAQQAVADMATELLELQAVRKSQPGIAFAEESVWQSQFDASFPYTETPDQLSAIAALKKDMTAARPMDRLICGDVGFGKTEVAMRAAFKAVDSGYQVAVLVPTTVLAEQHFKTFTERFSEFPFSIAKLSRFCTHAEQKQTLAELAGGKVDIVIGTHRLASNDVDFFNLGLMIIDEEQRFGVEVKEKLKLMRANVDILTLSATPIPRTLHMSLLGVRDISNLETAPEDRLSVETRVVRYSDTLVRNAILRELNRDGQIYFVHNRINDIHLIADRLQRIVPEARVVIGHGQMAEHQLEQVMVDFIEHRYDVLLATTIIESGLDIPNANTIFIDDADRYGLAELHQLRGRVGRYKHQAYCYLLLDSKKHLSPDAARRLHAIEEYSHIGAGFGIAMRDLEIRGAGNLLGTQQSGHIAAVGYELYCHMLENAVRTLTHQPPRITTEVDIDLPVDAFIPPDYVPEMRHKIDLYRRLTRLESVQQLEDIHQEMEDRFGAVPEPVKRLFRLAELRVDSAIWLIRSVTIEEDYLVFTYSDSNRIAQLARKHGNKLRIVDKQKAYYQVGHRREEKVDWLKIVQSILRR